MLLFITSSLISGSGGTGKSGGEDENGKIPGISPEERAAGAGSVSSATGGTDAQEELFSYIARQEERLERILQSMDGIGEVEVMISAASSGEKVTLSDNPYTQKMTEEKDSAGGTRKMNEVEREDTTIYESGGSTQTPYVVKELEPELSGVLVVAEGAGSDAVKAEIVEAVEALFGLPAHRIKVIKRRG